jgi:hypothetical protein
MSARWATTTFRLVTLIGLGHVPEGYGRVGRLVGEEQLVEARRATRQNPEPVPPGLGDHVRLDLSVDEELVAQDAVLLEQVEVQLAGGRIEQPVRQHQGNVVLDVAVKVGRVTHAWQPEPAGVVLVAVVQVVEHQVERGQALVDIL